MKHLQEKKPHGGRAALFVLFCFVLGAGGVASLLLPKQEVSELERRELAQLPEFSAQALFSGEYTRGLETYFADHFALREQFTDLAAQLSKWRGVRYDEIRVHHGYGEPEAPPVDTTQPQQPLSPGVSQSEPEQLPVQEVPASTPAPEEEQATGEQQGSVFLYKNMALPIFGGGSGSARAYASILNAYQQTLPDVAIYNLIVPSAIEFYLPERYRSVSTPQEPNIEAIYSALDSKIRRVRVIDALREHKDEYLYFRTDHHWTALGAYYAYQQFCYRAGFEPVPLEEMEQRSLDHFLGTLYSQTQDSKLAETPDRVDYYLPPQQHSAWVYLRGQPYTATPTTVWAEYAKGVNSYSVFLGGDHPLTVIKTGLDTGRKIVVVKESFGNAFAPFLISHYDEVHVVDQRYFQLGLVEYIRQNGITDLLFINNIFAANTGIRQNEISRLMYQVYTPPAAEPAGEENDAAEEPPEDDAD